MPRSPFGAGDLVLCDRFRGCFTPLAALEAVGRKGREGCDRSCGR